MKKYILSYANSTKHAIVYTPRVNVFQGNTRNAVTTVKSMLKTQIFVKNRDWKTFFKLFGVYACLKLYLTYFQYKKSRNKSSLKIFVKI